jgi:hypothetical protein
LSATLTPAVSGKTISFTLNGNSAGSAVTNGSGVATVSVSPLCGTSYNAGSYPTGVAASLTGDGSYSASNGTASLTVGKANATVVVTPYSVTYDGNPHTATVTSITGVCGETGATVGTADVSGTTHTNAGTYSSDTWSFTGTTNYNNIAATTITDTISKANATVVVDPYSVTYDGNAHTATVVSITGANGETGATVGTVDVSNTSHTNAGTYAADYWFFTGTANYNDIGNTTITDQIDKANASFTVTPYDVTYDGQSHTASVSTITGVNGETGATVGTVDVSGTTHTNAGTYTGDPWSFTATANYNDSNGTVDDNIDKANASFTVTPYNVTYDGAAHTATVSTITGVNGETGATVGTVDVSGTTHTNAGPYNGDAWSFTGTANYNDSNGTVDDNIDKADAAVVVAAYTCPTTTYTGLPHTATVVSITGVNGETGATVGAVDVSNTTHTNAGTYAADYWFFIGTANYNNIGNTTITDCIAKANAAVVVAAYTCPTTTYTGLPYTATVVSITGVNGETGATVGAVDVSNTTHTNAGTYAADYWFFTGTANYSDIGNTTITDCIAKANATIVVTPYNVAYDNQPHTATITSITGVNGETGATVGTVDVSHTTHTLPGVYSTDYWFFTGTANYNNISNTTITDTIGYGTCSGPNPGGVILPPINSDGTSVYPRRGGSTIPVKFTVCDANGNPISDPNAVFAGTGGQITLLGAVRGTVTIVNESGANDIPDAYFRYSDGKWIFNMATSNLDPGTTYTFRINLKVGSITFRIGIK